MPKVSVIVPIYNVEQYLSKCIESLLVQTLKDIEIILVDDGSTDTSSQMCDAYALQDNRIKVIHKFNGGLSEARNFGIEVAQGEYIGFLDSDDWVEDNFYEYLYSLIKRENADIAQCDYIKVYTDDVKIVPKEIIKESVYSNIEALYLLYGEESEKTVIVWNKLYKRELLEGIRFPKEKIHEDQFTTYKVLYKAKKVVNSNLQMIYYRQREGSIMAQTFSEKRLHILEAWDERMTFFKSNNLNELYNLEECRFCSVLQGFYIEGYSSNLKNRKEVLKRLKMSMKYKYVGFMNNPFITSRGKITLTLCLLNGSLFYKIYSIYKHLQNGCAHFFM